MTEFRDLTTLADLERVVELEKRIWEYTNGDDVVPIPVLAVTVHRGAILVGAFDGGTMVGFVYSIPAIYRGSLSHWSHMLGVLPPYRSTGLGRQLKLVQRERAMALGIDLIEWTYDPLLALNAYLNFAKLGVLVEEYEENIYGVSSSPLHGGLPTDRFVAQWWIRTPHVERRIAARADMLPLVSSRAASSHLVNPTRQVGRWVAPGASDLDSDADAIRVQIPPGFLQMLDGAPDLAGEWRAATRRIFTAYFAKRYRVVDFLFDRSAGTGSYLLSREATPAHGQPADAGGDETPSAPPRDCS